MVYEPTFHITTGTTTLHHHFSAAQPARMAMRRGARTANAKERVMVASAMGGPQVKVVMVPWSFMDVSWSFHGFFHIKTKEMAKCSLIFP